VVESEVETSKVAVSVRAGVVLLESGAGTLIEP